MRCDFTIAIYIRIPISFNPHTYMRCDKQALAIAQEADKFQSTHLHEVWHLMNRAIGKIIGFQSTHLHEVWHSITDTYTINAKFQSTHLHEVWQGKNCKINGRRLFQSTHLHEVWLSFFCNTPMLDCFNPHTYMRCDTLILLIRFIL